MDPAEALRRIAFLLERAAEPTYRVRAYRGAAAAVGAQDPATLHRLRAGGALTDLRGVGPKTATVVAEALDGQVPAYLQALEERLAPVATGGEALLAALVGDCHTHSDWSDGGSPPEEMALAARDAVGRQWIVLTDHSPRLTVARGLSPERLRAQLRLVAELNERLAPFRLLTGIEVDILDDGSLDQEPDLLAGLDVVVASVHSKLRMDREQMTRRMVTAVADANVDVLGHCTGRLLRGERGLRPESDFDPELVVEACRRFDVALEVNSRPERLDPPRRILTMAVQAGCLLAVDTDAHAPGQLDWQGYGTARATECGADPNRVVTTWSVDRLLAWTADRGGRT